jgi:hypothetical protein
MLWYHQKNKIKAKSLGTKDCRAGRGRCSTYESSLADQGRTSDGPAKQDTRLLSDTRARKERGNVVLQIGSRQRQVNVSVEGTGVGANKRIKNKKARKGDVPNSSM